MADELSPKKLFEPSPEEPKTEPLFPAPMQPIFQGGGEDIKPDPLNNPNFNFSGGEDIKKDPLDAQPIPQIFQGGGSQLVNYDFVDSIRNTGYVTFYPTANIGGASGALFQVLPEAISGSSPWHQTPYSAVDTYKRMTNDQFDITFNIPQNLKGDTFIIFPIGANNDDNVSDIKVLASGALFHYNGTTETFLGHGETEIINLVSTTLQGGYFNVKINIPAKHFKAGEILRLKLEGYAGHSVGTKNARLTIFHDPLNRTTSFPDLYYPTSYINGKAQILVPFKLDLN